MLMLTDQKNLLVKYGDFFCELNMALSSKEESYESAA
jgi:hypothetical protein